MKTLITRRFACATFLLASCAPWPGAGASERERPHPPVYDMVIRGGMLYDGSGAPPVAGDVAISGERIVAVGDLGVGHGATEIDARGMAVSPGFIDVVSFSHDFWLADSRALSSIYQGVTLEVLHGEGESMAPLTPAMKADLRKRQYQFQYDIPWDSFGGYLEHLQEKRTGINFAALVGGATVRRYVVGDEGRAATPDELARMGEAVRLAMREGAVGVMMGLDAPPGSYARREELVSLARAATEYGGVVSYGLRSESEKVLEALDEAFGVAREAGARLEISHLKVNGEPNWGRTGELIARIEAARSSGLPVTANLYTYTQMWTALSSALPPWAHEGGFARMLERLAEPVQRARIIDEMRNWSGGWEQRLAHSGKPENVFILKLDAPLQSMQGKTLADVMRLRNTGSPEAAAVDLVRDSGNEVWCAFTTMSEDGVRELLRRPWTSLGSDANSVAAEGIWLGSFVHPRTYGNFARFLGQFVRDEKLLSLQEAVRRMTSQPAQTYRLEGRGALRPGYFADVLVFDPSKVRDVATFANPHQYATGMLHVLVNGQPVLTGGRHTGKLPGHAARGPGAARGS